MHIYIYVYVCIYSTPWKKKPPSVNPVKLCVEGTTPLWAPGERSRGNSNDGESNLLQEEEEEDDDARQTPSLYAKIKPNRNIVRKHNTNSRKLKANHLPFNMFLFLEKYVYTLPTEGLARLTQRKKLRPLRDSASYVPPQLSATLCNWTEKRES